MGYVYVKSSDPDNFYEVELHKSEKGLILSCNCPAGIHGKWCKHKSAVIIGDETFLYGVGQEAALNDMTKKIQSSSMSGLLSELEHKDADIKAAQKAYKDTKSMIQRLMKEGF